MRTRGCRSSSHHLALLSKLSKLPQPRGDLAKLGKKRTCVSLPMLQVHRHERKALRTKSPLKRRGGRRAAWSQRPREPERREGHLGVEVTAFPQSSREFPKPMSPALRSRSGRRTLAYQEHAHVDTGEHFAPRGRHGHGPRLSEGRGSDEGTGLQPAVLEEAGEGP